MVVFLDILLYLAARGVFPCKDVPVINRFSIVHIFKPNIGQIEYISSLVLLTQNRGRDVNRLMVMSPNRFFGQYAG